MSLSRCVSTFIKCTNHLEETPQVSPEETQLFTTLLLSAVALPALR